MKPIKWGCRSRRRVHGGYHESGAGANAAGVSLRIVLLIGLVLPGPAAAQDGGETGFCVAQAEMARYQVNCIGLTADRCMASTLNQSTHGMVECLEAELQWWDARLNRTYGLLREREQREDAEMASDGVNAPLQAEALREMQRAWITYRDAACDFARSQWGGGTGGGPATLSCLMRQTALQAIHLQGYLEEY